MNDETAGGCPRIEDISALMDGELAAGAAQALRTHAARCPLCGAALRDFADVSTRLHALRDTRCDVDLAAIVRPQLPPRMPARPGKPARHWGGLWQLAPKGLGAAGALAAGAWLGMLLATGSGAALRPAGMMVFDAVPPGALCAGLPSCSPRGR